MSEIIDKYFCGYLNAKYGIIWRQVVDKTHELWNFNSWELFEQRYDITDEDRVLDASNVSLVELYPRPGPHLNFPIVVVEIWWELHDRPFKCVIRRTNCR